MMTTLAKPLLVFAPLMLLAACSGDDPAPPPVDNGVEMLDVTNEAVNVEEAPLVMNTPTPIENVADEPPPPVAEQERIQADADATGMTARVDRDAEAEEAPTNTAASGTVSEEK